MKTVLIITIESKDEYDNVYPEPLDEKAAEDYKTEDEKRALRNFREDFAIKVHERAIDAIESRLDEGDVDEAFLDRLDDYYIENWEERSDYGLTITISKEGLKEEVE